MYQDLSLFTKTLSFFINMRKVLTVLSLALKALKIVSASKQKYEINNQKELKFLVT